MKSRRLNRRTFLTAAGSALAAVPLAAAERSQPATQIWNGGRRGHKTEMSEGGHRVPCFFRWPFESGKTLTEGTKGSSDLAGARPIAKAQLIIANDKWSMDTKFEHKSVTLTVHLAAGKTKLAAEFMDEDGKLLCNAF